MCAFWNLNYGRGETHGKWDPGYQGWRDMTCDLWAVGLAGGSAESSATLAHRWQPSSFLSVSQKQSPSLTSTLLHLEHKHSSAPTPPPHHTRCSPSAWSRLWLARKHCRFFIGGMEGWVPWRRWFLFFFFFSFSLLLPSRSFWISVWQRKSQVAANTQHLGC